jgi:hypothetical protein
MRSAGVAGLLLANIMIAAAGPVEAIVLRRGDRAVTVDVELVLDGRLGDGGPRIETSALAWRMDGPAVVGRATGSFGHATVTLTPADGAIRLEVVLDHAADVVVEREAVRVRLPGAGHMLGRNLGITPIDRTLRVDRGTPIFVTTPDVAVVGGPGLAAAVATRGHGAVTLDLILDDAASHPFSTYVTCRAALPKPPIDWGALEHRTDRSRVVRAAGTTVRAEATIHLTADAALPLIVERWPSGTRAAVVITDHADRTDPAALRAVLWGTSDPADAGTAGLLPHGLAITKTFFTHAHIGGLADDPAVAPLARAVVAAGGEVASHSITPRADPRDTIAAGLTPLAPFGAVTWIDHEPYTNCEALSNQGWQDTAPFGLRDLLVAAGFRWVWAANDVKSPTAVHIADLFGGDPGAPAPVVFPFPPDPRLWAFRSEWFAAAPATLDAALSDAALGALEARRGLFVAHTYLSASPATTRSREHARMLAVRMARPGTLVLDPAIEEAFARLGARVRAATLASLPWRVAGDRLRALGDVGLRYTADGAAILENRSGTDLPGLTVAVEADVDLAVDGAAAGGTRREPGRTTTWFDLPRGARVGVRATHAGHPLRFLTGGPVTVELP